MIKHAFQIIIFLMGCGCIAMSFRYLVFFWGSRKTVGRSMVFLLTEQIVTAGCTLAFSLNSLLVSLSGRPQAEWNAISPEIAMVLRILMFGVMLHSTAHLSRSVREVINRGEQT